MKYCVLTAEIVLQCYQGVLPLNFFLEKAVHVAEDADIGVKMIRKQLRAFIETEDKKKPLSDEKIRQKFQEKNKTYIKNSPKKLNFARKNCKF